MVSRSSLMYHGNVDDSHIPSFSFNQYSREKGGYWNQSWRFYQLPTTKIVSLFLSLSFPARMDHTSEQPTLVHAKFLVALFKKRASNLPVKCPRPVKFSWFCWKTISRLNPFGTSWLIYFGSVYPFPSRHFPLIWQVKHDETPGRHWGIIIPRKQLKYACVWKWYNPQLLPFI